MLVAPGEPANSLKPPMIGQMPNGLEMRKMQTSRASFASGSRMGNKVAPVIPEIEVEVSYSRGENKRGLSTSLLIYT